MRVLRALIIYFLAVFVGGALLAPLLFWLTQSLAIHAPVFAPLAANPFHRFVNRSLLSVAFLGLVPLLSYCGMLHWRDLGLVGRRPVPAVGLGFLTGFLSLACVAALGICFGGRAWNGAHSGQQLVNHIISAGVSAVIVASLEELLFRGALFGLLRKAAGWKVALVVSSAIYALAHFLHKTDAPKPVTWFSGLQALSKMFDSGPPLVPAVFILFAAGSILALAYQRAGNLFFSIGLHGGWIFWLKSYGFFTVGAAGANPRIWGTDNLIDGWLALPILGIVFWLVSKMNPKEKEAPA